LVSYPGMASRTQPDGQVRLMTKVAHMYHEQGIRQTDIASTLHISQAKVSRLLKRAAETGIVRTIVAVTPGVHTDLEEALEQRFRLLEAVVVDVEGDEPEVLAGLGSAGARYLENTLTGGERLGISSWSQTLLAVVDRLRPLRVPGAETVVQLVGGMGVPAVQTQANRLLGELAERVGASPRFAPAPTMVGRREIAENLLADPVMADVARQWRELTMALVGIGSLEPSELLQLSGNAVDPPDQQTLLAQGAVGDVCHRFFSADGELIASDIDARVVGIAPEVYRAIPRRVGVAGGLRKRKAIHAAIKGGWVNVIITDLATAGDLLAA
jgi:DNA-binding transcriptional regulator LsrR (DeoR family)